MYLIDRLRKMNELLDNNSIDKELAQYLLNHLNQNMTLQKCISDTLISKASIHRFYSKAGFDSFKNLVHTLYIENNDFYFQDYHNLEDKLNKYIENYDLSQKNIDLLIKQILECKRVAFYGNQKEIDALSNLIHYFNNHHIETYSLNTWNIESAYERVKYLEEDDIFIVVDTTMRIQNMYEMGMNHNYLINLELLNLLPCQKFYIGECNCEEYLGYKNIKVSRFYNHIGMSMLDEKIYQELEVKNK